MPISKEEQKKNYEDREKLKQQLGADRTDQMAMSVSQGTIEEKKNYWLGDLILKIIIWTQAVALIFFIMCYILMTIGVHIPVLSDI